jgi:outer membrane protein assembly factor BamB
MALKELDMMPNRGLCRLTVVLCISLASGSTPAADWPQWGGDNHRNMVSAERGLPDCFDTETNQRTGEGDGQQKPRNVKWVVRLGAYAYGNPTVADGRVFVGTSAHALSGDARFKYTKGGLLMCLDESGGKLLWQLPIPERGDLPAGTHFGHQHLGVCSSPTVDEDRVYIVTSAGDILCLDVNGQHDGNAGPFTDEALYMAGSGQTPIELNEKDGDIIWRFDPIDELEVRPHDAASCSALIVGDMVYVGTSNGVDKPHTSVISPLAPSLIVLDKRSGTLVATDNERIGTRMYHAQWSPPSSGTIRGKTLIFFGGGDGVCYAFEAIRVAAEEPVFLKKVWSYDCNPPEYKFRDDKPIPYYAGDKRKSKSPNKNDGTYVGPSQIIGTPVFHKGRIYVALGQDPAHGRGKGMLHCIDASRTGDITETGSIWRYGGMDRSLATAAIANGLVYITDVAGRLHCLDAQDGRCHWVHETNNETWGGPLVADGKLFFGNRRSLYVMAEGREARLLQTVRMPAPVYSTPIAANGALYVACNRYLWAAEATP